MVQRAIVAMLLLFLVAGVVADMARENKKTLTAHRTDQPPTIDGRLDEPAWEKAEAGKDFIAYTSWTQAAKEQTTVRVLYDDDHVYIGVECLEPKMDLVREAIEANPDTLVYQQGQTVEIFLGYRANRRNFLQIMVNTNGSVLLYPSEPMKIKNIDLETAVHLGEDRFSIEVKVPYSVLHLLPNPKGVWDFQVGRARMIEGTPGQIDPKLVYSVWSPTWHSFRIAEYFGYLEIPIDPVEYYYHIDPEVRDDNYHLVVTNHTGSDNKVVMEVFVDGSEEPELYPLDLKAEKSQTVEFPLDRKSGTELNVFIKDAETEKLLYQGGTALHEMRDEMIDILEKDFELADISEETYVVFVKDYMDRANNNTQPQVDEIGKPMRIFASLGEYKPASFAVRSNQDLGQVEVRLTGDLKGPGGATISKDRVEIRVVELMNRWLTPSEYIRTETYLIRNRPRNILTDSTQRYWLTLHAPQDATPGRYRTEVEVAPANEEARTIALEVEILPIRLDPPEGMHYFMYFKTGFPGLLPQELRTEEYLRKIYTDMREHGMTMGNVFAFPEKDDVYADERDNMPFGTLMEVMLEENLVAPWAAVPWWGAESSRKEGWLNVLQEGRDRGWPEIILYLVDEPGVGRYEYVETVMGRLAELKEEHPEFSDVRTTSAGAENPVVSHFYDVWIAGESISKEHIDRGKEEGKEVWSYDCGLAPVDAQTARYYFGLVCWKNGLDGAAFWAYFDRYHTHDRFDISGPWRDSERDLIEYKNIHGFVYPLSEELVPTIGWEATREGVDDYRYLQTLKNTIERAREAGVAASLIAQAQTVIKEVEDSIDTRNLGEKRGEATNRVGVIRREFERYPPEEDLVDGGYDRLRYKIAQEIVKLNAMMEYLLTP